MDDFVVFTLCNHMCFTNNKSQLSPIMKHRNPPVIIIQMLPVIKTVLNFHLT